MVKNIEYIEQPTTQVVGYQKEIMKTVLTVSLNKGFIIVYLYKESNK